MPTSHAEASVRYYDTRSSFRRPSSDKDRIRDVRRFNNHAKRVLIQRWWGATGTVLDLGCGRGGDIHKLKDAGMTSYTGVDSSRQSLLEAADRCTRASVVYRLVEHDVFCPSLSEQVRGTYDLALSNFVVQNASEPGQIVAFFKARRCSSSPVAV